LRLFRSLNDALVKAFTTLGSQLIARLKFRAVWAFVGQRGIAGTSPIEQVPPSELCRIIPG